ISAAGSVRHDGQRDWRRIDGVPVSDRDSDLVARRGPMAARVDGPKGNGLEAADSGSAWRGGNLDIRLVIHVGDDGILLCIPAAVPYYGELLRAAESATGATGARHAEWGAG